jgi:hypothetical protein
LPDPVTSKFILLTKLAWHVMGEFVLNLNSLNSIDKPQRGVIEIILTVISLQAIKAGFDFGFKFLSP